MEKSRRARRLSLGIIMALIMTLVIPMPVAAKGSKGGKLVKNVTVYNYRVNRWQKAEKKAYTYNKKAYPSQIATTSYGNYYFGVPFSATVTNEKTKYKFKGKTPKSMTLKNDSGKVVAKYKYKKGLVTSETYSDNSSYVYGDYDENENLVAAYEDYRTTNNKTTYTYNKKGLVTSADFSKSSVEVDAKNPANNSTSSYTSITSYAVTQKKGIPGRIVATETTTSSVYNGIASDLTGWTPNIKYANFNKNGLTTEIGDIDVDSTTQAQTQRARYKIVYKTKKGLVTQATVYILTTDANGVVTKEQPLRMYKFKYEKTKISKARYMNMMNCLIGFTYGAAHFSWM